MHPRRYREPPRPTPNSRLREKLQAIGVYTGIHAVILFGLLGFDTSVSLAIKGGDVRYYGTFFLAIVFAAANYLRVVFSSPGWVIVGHPEDAAEVSSNGYARVSTVDEHSVALEMDVLANTPSKVSSEHSSKNTPLSPANGNNNNNNSNNNNNNGDSGVTTPAAVNATDLCGDIAQNLAKPIPFASQAQPLSPAAPHRQPALPVRRQDICYICHIIRPPRSKHCFMCGKCCIRMDHHCPFIGNCVGGRNHHLFWNFLITQAVVILWAFWVALSAFRHVPRHGSAMPWIIRAMHTIFTFSFTMLVVSLAGFHSYLAVIGGTTLDMVRRQRQMYRRRRITRDLEMGRRRREEAETFNYSKGVVKNLMNFFTATLDDEWIYGIPYDESAMTRSVSRGAGGPDDRNGTSPTASGVARAAPFTNEEESILGIGDTRVAGGHSHGLNGDGGGNPMASPGPRSAVSQQLTARSPHSK